MMTLSAVGRVRGQDMVNRAPAQNQLASTGRLLGGVAVVLTLALTACGGDDSDSDLPTVAEVAPELAEFGDLATVHSQPVFEAFGPDGGEMDLADGSRVEVPEGAFSESTELTAAIVDVEVEDPVKELRVYHLSTVEDIGPLGEPVVLEVPGPVDEMVAAELVDGEWQILDLPPGPTARVEIDHFSVRDVAVITCALLVSLSEEELTDPDDPRLFAFRICLDQAAGALGLESPTATPNISSEDQAWITYVVDDTANELERAGAPNDEIAGGKGAMRTCLTNALEGGDSREAALAACETAAAPYFPTATPASTATSAETLPPGATAPSTPAPAATQPPAGGGTPTPTPTPTPSPALTDTPTDGAAHYRLPGGPNGRDREGGRVLCRARLRLANFIDSYVQ